jgi:hypothetical protein
MNFTQILTYVGLFLVIIVKGGSYMNFTQMLTYIGLFLVIIIIGVAGSMLRISLTKKVLKATQKDKPKSKLQQFFGW